MSDDIVDKLIYTLNAEQSRTAHYLERAERAEAELQRIRDSDDTSSGRQREALRAEREALRADVEAWRHIAQEQYAWLRRARDPRETGYPIEGALDSLFRGYRTHGKYSMVFCSQCGGSFLHHNYHGYSHCEDHQQIDAALREGKA